MTEAPLRHLFALGKLSQAGADIAVIAKDEELTRLAAWACVAAVRRFAANVSLRRLSQTRFALEAQLEADIVQNCVVTLDPVESHIARTVARELHYAPHPKIEGGELTLASGDEDVPEEIASLEYDLAAPLLEDFVLAIDPYKRKEGVAFAPPGEAIDAPSNPFAALKSLKGGG